MKKWNALVLALMMCLSLCACGGGVHDYANTPSANEEASTSTSSEPSTSDNEDFIAKYDSDIVVAAKMTLDNFISDYELSLATQKWTIAMFDETGDTVIAMSDITYNNQTGKYIFVGTLNFDDSGKVVSATPHYLEVNGSVLGDDGYCNDVFEKISELG